MQKTRLLLALIGLFAPATGWARSVAVAVVALDHKLDHQAAVAGRLLRLAAQGDASVQLIDLERVVQGDAERARLGRQEQAKALFQQGLDSLDNLQEAAALEKINQAAALALQGDLRIAMPFLLDVLGARALTQIRLGRVVEGNGDLAAVLAINPQYQFDPARTTPEVQRAVDDARRQVLAAAPLSLQVQTTPAPAEVWVDGIFRGVSPVDVSDLKPGTHFVTVAGTGYDLAQEQHVIVPGDVLHLAMSPAFAGQRLLGKLGDLASAWASGSPTAAAQALAALANADEVVCLGLAPPSGSDPNAAPELRGIRVARDGRMLNQSSGPLASGELLAADIDPVWHKLEGSDAKVEATQGSRGIPAGGIATAAIAGAAVVGAIVFFSQASSYGSQAQTATTLGEVGTASNDTSAQGLYSSLGYVSIGVAVVSAAVSGYLFYQYFDAAPSTASIDSGKPGVAARVWAVPGAGGVAVVGRF